MLREKLIDKRVGDNKKFRWRSHEVSRTEGLSDAVFGFAITLLVVSLEVPNTFAELMEAMQLKKMTIRFEFWPALAFEVVILVWLVNIIAFLIPKKTPFVPNETPSAPDKKRDRF